MEKEHCLLSSSEEQKLSEPKIKYDDFVYVTGVGEGSFSNQDSMGSEDSKVDNFRSMEEIQNQMNDL